MRLQVIQRIEHCCSPPSLPVSTSLSHFSPASLPFHPLLSQSSPSSLLVSIPPLPVPTSLSPGSHLPVSPTFTLFFASPYPLLSHFSPSCPSFQPLLSECLFPSLPFFHLLLTTVIHCRCIPCPLLSLSQLPSIPVPIQHPPSFPTPFCLVLPHSPVQ